MALVSSSLWLVTGLMSPAPFCCLSRRIVEAMWMQPRPSGGDCRKPAVYLPLWLIALANIYFDLMRVLLLMRPLRIGILG